MKVICVEDVLRGGGVRSHHGICRSVLSRLISASTSRPSFRGRFRSRMMNAGRDFSVHLPGGESERLFAVPGNVQMAGKAASLKASCINRISPGLSSTRRISAALDAIILDGAFCYRIAH
jgi:hypothetical protein